MTGVIDLVELEHSQKRIFTKKGRPTADYIQGEQQILDWLRWTEENYAYEQKKFQFLIQPFGWLIIGRSCLLSEQNRKTLNHRNQIMNGRVFAMTYDDLVERAKNLLHLISREEA